MNMAEALLYVGPLVLFAIVLTWVDRNLDDWLEALRARAARRKNSKGST